jgi:hypothetical protein
MPINGAKPKRGSTEMDDSNSSVLDEENQFYQSNKKQANTQSANIALTHNMQILSNFLLNQLNYTKSLNNANPIFSLQHPTMDQQAITTQPNQKTSNKSKNKKKENYLDTSNSQQQQRQFGNQHTQSQDLSQNRLRQFQKQPQTLAEQQCYQQSNLVQTAYSDKVKTNMNSRTPNPVAIQAVAAPTAAKPKQKSIKYTGEAVGKFKNYLSLHRELERCKKIHLITSAYINHQNELIIKYDLDEKYVEITENWPTDAFEKGIILSIKTTRFFAAIKHVDTELDLNDNIITEYLLNNYGITNATRL